MRTCVCVCVCNVKIEEEKDCARQEGKIASIGEVANNKYGGLKT